MTTLSRRGLLATTGALSLAGVLAACADTGADGKAVASSSASDADYDKAINSGPVAAADVVAASPWAASVKTPRRRRSPASMRPSPRRWPATSSAATTPAPSSRSSRSPPRRARPS